MPQQGKNETSSQRRNLDRSNDKMPMKLGIAQLMMFGFGLLFGQSGFGQLAVVVSPPALTGQKVVVKMAMTNTLKTKIESARAALFLLDEHGSMLGQASRWVIGGTKERSALEPGKEATFNFVVQAGRQFNTTNLTANISFTQLVLDGGQAVDPVKNVTINTQKKD